MEKRSYQNRKQEFYDMTVEQIQASIKDQAAIIKTCNEKLVVLVKDTSVAPGTHDDIIVQIKREKTEANNKRIRAYDRLRKLGHSSKKVRQENAEINAQVSTPTSPEEQKS
jgi:ornithine cyclodeaminase/alanine dehydrogenase-like protein (mu-crystallin family)